MTVTKTFCDYCGKAIDTMVDDCDNKMEIKYDLIRTGLCENCKANFLRRILYWLGDKLRARGEDD